MLSDSSMIRFLLSIYICIYCYVVAAIYILLRAMPRDNIYGETLNTDRNLISKIVHCEVVTFLNMQPKVIAIFIYCMFFCVNQLRSRALASL